MQKLSEALQCEFFMGKCKRRKALMIETGHKIYVSQITILPLDGAYTAGVAYHFARICWCGLVPNIIYLYQKRWAQKYTRLSMYEMITLLVDGRHTIYALVNLNSI